MATYYKTQPSFHHVAEMIHAIVSLNNARERASEKRTALSETSSIIILEIHISMSERDSRRARERKWLPGLIPFIEASPEAN